MFRAAWIAALLLVSSPVCAKTGLKAVAEEAKKPPAEQKVVGQGELSEVKDKEPAQAAEPPAERSGVVHAPQEPGVIAGVGAPYPPPYLVSSVGLVDPVEEPPRPSVRWRVGAVAGGGGLAADAFGPHGSGGLLLGLRTGALTVDLRGQYSRGTFADGLELAFKDLQGFSGDAVGRIRLSEEYASFEVNFLLLARLGRYDWNFRNPVQVAEPEGIRTYDHDAIRYRAFMAGLGFVPLRSWEWSLQLTAAGGHQRFASETSAGFDNDLFHNGAVVEVLAEVVYSPF